MNCPKSLRIIYSIDEVFAMIESVVCVFLTDNRVFVKKDYSKFEIISNANLPRASPITVEKSDKHHLAAKSVLNRAIELRETIFRIYSSIAEGNSAANKELAVFNKYLSTTMRFSQIIKKKGGFYWDTTGDKAKLEWILNPIIRSAAELMISRKLRKVKKCSDPVCGWLFLDISRNQSRRWCDMQDCGNRAKASRFSQKKADIKK